MKNSLRTYLVGHTQYNFKQQQQQQQKSFSEKRCWKHSTFETKGFAETVQLDHFRNRMNSRSSRQNAYMKEEWRIVTSVSTE